MGEVLFSRVFFFPEGRFGCIFQFFVFVWKGLVFSLDVFCVSKIYSNVFIMRPPSYTALASRTTTGLPAAGVGAP